jgi:ParB family transcriptional regulator, chromosome partitioning protein
MIENVQRHTLNPIEESLAFKKYICDFGWGGISELSQKLSKSTSYIWKRMKLLELPKDVFDLISKSEINVSVAEELLPIMGKRTQSKLTELIIDKHLSSRTVRKVVKTIRTKTMDKDSYYYPPSRNDNEIIQRLLDNAIIAVRISIKKMAAIIEKVEDEWILYEILMQLKHTLH